MSRSDNAAATRDRILDAARTQFEEYGYTGPTIRSIADQAKVAVGTVMLHFQDKQGLLAAALDQQIETALTEMAAHPPSPEHPLPRRLAILAAPLYAQYFVRPSLARVLIAEGLFVHGQQAARQHEQLGRFRSMAAACAKTTLDDSRLDTYMAAYLFVLVLSLRDTAPDLQTAIQMLERMTATIKGFTP